MQTMWFVMFENGFQFTNRKYLLLTISLAKDILTNPIWKSRNTKQTDALISKLPITVWSYVCSTWLPLDSISILPIEFPVTPKQGLSHYKGNNQFWVKGVSSTVEVPLWADFCVADAADLGAIHHPAWEDVILSSSCFVSFKEDEFDLRLWEFGVI